MEEPAIGLIILAAGASTRMGTPKQLLCYRGESFLLRTAKTALASACRPIIVVLGANAQDIASQVSQLSVEVVENPQWSLGIGTSIRTGIEVLMTSHPNVEAAIILLCDHPLVSSQLIDQIVAAYRLTKKSIVASQYAGTLGVPALFDRTLFSELIALEAKGAKQVIQKYDRDVFGVPFASGTIDIDTPTDYEQLLRS